MARNKTTAKDITGSLVHFDKAGGSEAFTEKQRDEQWKAMERPMAFDALGYAMWTCVGLLIAAQFFLMVSVSLS